MRGRLKRTGCLPRRLKLLLAIARWEVRSLLDHGLRLRTACEFEPLNDDDDIQLADAEDAGTVRSAV